MITLKFAALLFVFEMVNNHMGDVEHGVRIVREALDTSGPFICEVMGDCS
ncbi:MAG: hypothetical protein IMZ57_02310 [Acidobacteria bacterium]|nr:hypothetical protein [Acidobacteriota bacterium]